MWEANISRTFPFWELEGKSKLGMWHVYIS